MKIRKNHSRKRYRYNVNRKALQKKKKTLGKVKDLSVKHLWEEAKKPEKNFYEMGLSADPNKTVPIPNFKQQRLQVVKVVEDDSDDEDEQQASNVQPRTRAHIAKELEEQSKLRPDPQFRLPKGVVAHLSYFLDKYKLNYKAMVTDKRNHDQWTWKQFRLKIRKFMAIPEQFNEYLKKKELPIDRKLPWPEYDSDSEWT